MRKYSLKVAEGYIDINIPGDAIQTYIFNLSKKN